MKNIIKVFSFNTFSKFLVAIATILMIRVLTSEEYAEYILLLSLITIFTQGILAGVNRVYLLHNSDIKESKDTKKRTISSFLGFQLIIVFVMYIIMLPIASLGYQVTTNYISVILIGVLGMGIIEFSKVVYQKELLFSKYSYIEISRNFIPLFIILVLLVLVNIFNLGSVKGKDIILLQSLGFIFLGLFSVSGMYDYKYLFSTKTVTNQLSTIFKQDYKYILVYFVILAVFGQLDILMLKAYGKDVELASYGSAYRYYSILLLILGSIHTVIIPMIQKASTIEEIKKIYKIQFKISYGLIPFVIIFSLFVVWVIPIIDEGKYPTSQLTFIILAISSLFSIYLSPYSNLIQKFKEYRFLPISVSIAFVINISLNFFMIPLYGAPGAATATLISYGVQNFMIFFKARSIVKEIF